MCTPAKRAIGNITLMQSGSKAFQDVRMSTQMHKSTAANSLLGKTIVTSDASTGFAISTSKLMTLIEDEN